MSQSWRWRDVTWRHVTWRKIRLHRASRFKKGGQRQSFFHPSNTVYNIFAYLLCTNPLFLVPHAMLCEILVHLFLRSVSNVNLTYIHKFEIKCEIYSLCFWFICIQFFNDISVQCNKCVDYHEFVFNYVRWPRNVINI